MSKKSVKATEVTATETRVPEVDLAGAPIIPQPTPEDLEAELEQVLSEIQAEAEANDTQAEAPTAVEAVEAPAEVIDTRTVSEILQEQLEADRDQMLVKIGAAYDARAEFEKVHNPLNGNIQGTLAKQRKKMALPGIAALMMATNTSPEVINRSISEGKRFNVYAIDKLNDLLHGLNSGHFKNEINIAVMKSLFKFRKAGVVFTGEAALAAASDKVQIEKQMKALLVRHTVSAATGPTQASSTMAALSAIGAVVNKGTVKFPIWELTNKPVVRALEAKFAA